MKRLMIILGIILAAGLYTTSAVADDQKGKKEETGSLPAELQAKIKSLIKDLAADDAKVREKATKDLKEIGEPAVPALKESLESDDPEVAWRARIILKAIERAKQKEPEPTEDTIKTWPGKEPKEPTDGSKDQETVNKFQIIIQGKEPYQSFSFNRDASGKITVVIKKKAREGEEKTETYEAPSLEEFIKKYPEITKQYGLDKPAKPLTPEMPPDELWEDLGDSWSRQFDRIHKQMKEMDDLMRRLMEEQGINENDLPAVPLRKTPRETPPAAGELGMMVSPVEPVLREQLTLPDENGIIVQEVKKDSLAEKIGFKQWDVVLKVNDNPVVSIWEFKRLMKESLSKGEVQLTIIRKGAQQVLKYKK